MKTLSILGLLFFSLQTNAAIGNDPADGLELYVYVECCGKDSVIILDHAGLQDSVIRIFSPTGKLVYQNRSDERTDKERIVINGKGAYWILCSNKGDVRTMRLLVGKSSEGA